MVNILQLIFYPIFAFFGHPSKRVSSVTKESEVSLTNLPGKPLMVTPYIESGDILEAQRLSKVSPNIEGVVSYSGFFTVKKSCGNNLFFWFILSETEWKKAPVVLWLNGGPGASSLFGLFQEVGPWNNKKGKFIKNRYPWTKNNNIIFLDQPVGTGFSFTEGECYVHTNSEAAEQVYSALVQFFTMFPDLQNNKFFMTGMSFAGHYLPEIGVLVDKGNVAAKVKINFKGIVVGSPAIDYTCQYKGELLFQIGVVDQSGRDSLKSLDQKLKENIHSNNFAKASIVDYQINMKLISFGLKNYKNILDDADMSFEFGEFLTSSRTRKQIHVGDAAYDPTNMKVFGNLRDGYYTSTAAAVEYLLKKKYIVGFYHGQLDTICSYAMLSCTVQSLKWDGAAGFAKAERHPWYVSRTLAGWVRVYDNLFTVQIRNAGHHIPADQGEAAFTLISAVLSQSAGTKLLSTLKTTK